MFFNEKYHKTVTTPPNLSYDGFPCTCNYIHCYPTHLCVESQNMVMICVPYLAPDLQMPAGFFPFFLSPADRLLVAGRP